jgi:Tol biopolymer transport system component
VQGHDTTPTPTPVELGIFADVRGWIAYGNDEGIWAVNPTGGTPPDRVQLSERPGEPVAWSADGSKLLIRGRTPEETPNDFFDDLDLFVLSADGTETHLVKGLGWSAASFSPDGSKVIYDRTTHLGGHSPWQSGIYVVDADGGSPRLVLAAGPRDYPDGTFRTALFGPTFSPDGTQIAYFDGMGDWGNTLRVMNPDGSDVRVVFSQEYSHVDKLAWSPDGSRLAFNGTGGGVSIVGVDGSGLIEVDGKEVRWSPTGSRLVFQSGSPSSAGLWVGEGIWVMNADGSGRRKVVPLGREPVWSPDGSRIAYLGNAPHPSHEDEGSLYVANLDGTHILTLGTLSPPRPTAVVWNPLPPSAS